MTNYEKTNRGMLESPAIYRGSLDVKGSPFFMWVFRSVSKKGDEFYSLKISRENKVPTFNVENKTLNNGVLFLNKQKKSEKSPDFSGSINVEGNDMNIAAWQFGPALSVLVSDKQQQYSQTPTPMRQVDPDPFGDEVPF